MNSYKSLGCSNKQTNDTNEANKQTKQLTLKMEIRTFNDRRPLGPDRYGNVFTMGNKHRGMDHISTIHKDGKPYEVPGGGKQRASFMWMDTNGQLYIVVGKGSQENKIKLVNNEVKLICKVAPRKNHEDNSRWCKNWECYWHNWDGYPYAYAEFIKFVDEVNFLDE